MAARRELRLDGPPPARVARLVDCAVGELPAVIAIAHGKREANVSIDLQRILEAAARAAVEEQAKAASASRKTKKRRLSTGRAMLLGAGLATAGRLVVGHKGRDVLGRAQEWIADFKSPQPGEPEEAEDYEDELEDYEPESGVADDEGLADDGDEVADEPLDDDQESDADTEEDGEARETLEPEPPGRRTRRQRGRA
ncbi:MAG TPA: hypothetical protein VFH80_06490 [Solirubrobacteraceae bacterium]|nr:hypothetical protein [Solirubrobacteraceae bacterium]